MNMKIVTPPLIKKMNWIFVGCFLAEFFLSRLLGSGNASVIHPWFGLVPHKVVSFGAIWQLVTYLFFHGNLTHLLFNMLAFWMFGSELCQRWSKAMFLKFFFACGVGSGLFHVLTTYIFFADGAQPYIPTIGASGAIYGILMAYALLFGERMILFFFIFPMRARTAVLIIGGIEVFYSISQTQDGIAHLAHLGGMLAGYLYLRMGTLKHKVALWRYQKERDKLKSRLKVIVDNTKRKKKGWKDDQSSDDTIH